MHKIMVISYKRNFHKQLDIMIQLTSSSVFLAYLPLPFFFFHDIRHSFKYIKTMEVGASRLCPVLN